MRYQVGLDVRMLPNSGIGTYLRGLLSGFREIGFEGVRCHGKQSTRHSDPANGGRRISTQILKQDPSKNPIFIKSQDDGRGEATQDDEGRVISLGVSNADSLGQTFAFNAPIYSFQEQLAYPRLLKQCALWHSPHYNVPLWKGKTRLVVTIHDIIHWIFRKEFLNPVQAAYAGFMMRRAVASADHIITVSQHTKKDLIEHFGADPDKITPIPLGVSADLRPMPPAELTPAFEKLCRKYAQLTCLLNDPAKSQFSGKENGSVILNPEEGEESQRESKKEILRRYAPQDDGAVRSFFLYVGLMKPHKNVLSLVRTFRKLKAEGKVQSALVLVGRKDKRYPKGHEAIADLISDQEVIHLPSVASGELPILYNQALALVHPSLYEGFGLPPLEAMACGTPVLTTNAASLPEVVGDAALRVDATDEAGMAAAMVRLEQDPGLRESLRQKGLARANMFSWTVTARKTMEVYDRVLNK